VQGILKNALSERFSDKISVIGASRTDAGVHSRGQAIHFDVEKPIENIQNFEFTMNRVLPDDIRIYNVSIAPGGTPEQILENELWHATKSAIGKVYSYTFCTNKYIDPMFRKYCGHMYFPVDIQLLEKSLKLFVGTHDFSAFSNQVDRKKIEFATKNMSYSTIKTIYSIDLIPLNDYGSSTNLHCNHLSSRGPNHITDQNTNSGYYRIDIYLNSALYRMVRNIVWACAYTAGGMMTYEDLESLLNPDKPYISVVPTSPPPGPPSLINTILTGGMMSRGSSVQTDMATNINKIVGDVDPLVLLGNGPAEAVILPIRCKNIAKPAPPEGLCLERVLYHHY
jgi:tRNA pseudouridine38-40 synthase